MRVIKNIKRRELLVGLLGIPARDEILAITVMISQADAINKGNKEI